MSDGGDIIIRGGGSVHVTFDSGAYENDGNDKKTFKHKTKNMTRVKVTDEGGKVLFDSGENDKGLKWEVRVFTKG